MIQLGMVCEAKADQVAATTLARRILGREVTSVCIDPRVDRDQTFTCWKNLDEHRNVWPRHHFHGHRGGGPVHGQTVAARKALRFFKDKVKSVVLMVDGDDEASERLAALERARSESADFPQQAVIIGVPMPEREAWCLAGFEPTPGEEDRVNEIRTDLGFDPRFKSHLLKHGDDGAKRNAKRVLWTLTDANVHRENACLSDTSLETLKSRGLENGLAHYMDQIPALEQIFPRV